MHALIEEFMRRTPVVTDGAWGTQLQARGLQLGDSAECWSVDHPEKVEEVARAYVEAGSEIVLTNTFGANRLALEKHGLGDRALEINRAGAEISRRAAGDEAKVFASIGPSGKMLMMDEVSVEELETAFAEQAQALADGGADGLVVETMTDADEAKIAIAAAAKTGLPVVGCMVFDSGPNKSRTIMGLTPEDAATALEGAGAEVIGANCGQGIEGFLPVCRRLCAATRRPVWIKANAGLPEMLHGEVVYRTGPEEFVTHVPALIEAGASFVGGCCGTSPDFIRAVVADLEAGR